MIDLGGRKAGPEPLRRTAALALRTVALAVARPTVQVFPVRSSMPGHPVTTLLTAERRCLVCDFVEQVTEPEGTDEIGPICSRCQAPTERTAILARRTRPREPNPHAAALGRLGGLKGGPARARALSGSAPRALPTP